MISDGITFSTGLPSMEPDKILVRSVGEDGKNYSYSGFFVRHLENGGVILRDDELGAIYLPSSARWKYERY